MTPTSREITVLVGTDHHPFARLVAWADAWQATHPKDLVNVQYGASHMPLIARGYECFSIENLRETVHRSDVVITHGGPGTIMEVRAMGHRPIIFGRDSTRGEHVDDHQLIFVQWAASKGLGHLVADTVELQACVEAVGPQGTREPVGIDDTTQATARRVADLVAALRASRRDSPGSIDSTLVDTGAQSPTGRPSPVVASFPRPRAPWHSASPHPTRQGGLREGNQLSAKIGHGRHRDPRPTGDGP